MSSELPPRARAAFAREERPLFCRYLASALAQELPLDEAARAYAGAARGRRSAQLLFGVAARLERGARLDEALRPCGPELFPEAFLAALGAGEEAGILPRALPAALESLERQEELRARTLAALRYPAALALLGLLLVAFTSVFVAPAFAAMYESLGTPLPALTRLFLRVCAPVGFLSHFLGLALVAAVIARAAAGPGLLPAVMGKVPGFAGLLRRERELRLLRSLAGSLTGGLAPERALALCREPGDGPELAGRLGRAAGLLRGGARPSAALREAGFPERLVWACALGEEREDLAGSLAWRADYDELWVRAGLERLIPLVERSANAALGVFVGLAAVALLAPIFSLALAAS